MASIPVVSIVGLRFTEHAVKRSHRLQVVKPGHIIVDMTNADGDSEVVEIDFSTWQIKQTTEESQEVDRKGWSGTSGTAGVPNNLDDVLPDVMRSIEYSNEARVVYGREDADLFAIDVEWYHAPGSRPTFTTVYRTESFPAYPVWDDTDQEPLVPTVTYSEASMNYPQQAEVAVYELEGWRKQKRAWLLELEQRSDLNPELVKHGGYWLRAADAALQHEFQDPDVDQVVVAQMARLARQGASDIDSVDKFAENLNQFSGAYPTGPTVPTLWVTKGSGNGSLGDVERLNLADSHAYSEHTLADDYNPIDSEWQVMNQPGAVTVSTTTPDANTSVTAEVTDPDGGVTGVTYQWQKLVGATWTDESGETGSSYLIAAGTAAGTQFRVLAAYTDNYGPDQSAVSATITVQ